MQVDIRGALRFKHRAGLDRGVAAFDAEAYPEFFNSDLWTLVGPFAFCERSFEIEPDCDYHRAFLAMARQAVEGVIDLRESGRKEGAQILKLGKPLNAWFKNPKTHGEAFGRDVATFATAWADGIAKAKTADVAAAAKTAKRAAKDGAMCRVVELERNPTNVVIRPDGSLAVSAGSKVVFVAPTGEVMGEVECKLEDYSQFGLGISGLHALPDGRVLAFQELADYACLATLGEARAKLVAESTLGASRPVNSGASAHGLTVLACRHSFIVLDGDRLVREVTPWADNYVRAAVPWPGGVLVASSSKTAGYDRDGTKQFELDGQDPLVFDGGFVVRRDDRTVAVVDETGTVRHTLEVGDVGWIHRDGEYVRAWAVRGSVLTAAMSSPTSLGAWDLATGKEQWRVTKQHTLGAAGCAATARWAVSWAEAPIIAQQKSRLDTTLAAFRDGTEIARVDPKALALGALAISDDDLAFWVDGRAAGTKVYVWRDISTTPRLETLTGHKGRVRGLVALSGRLISFAADKTLRIWTT